MGLLRSLCKQTRQEDDDPGSCLDRDVRRNPILLGRAPQIHLNSASSGARPRRQVLPGQEIHGLKIGKKRPWV